MAYLKGTCLHPSHTGTVGDFNGVHEMSPRDVPSNLWGATGSTSSTRTQKVLKVSNSASMSVKTSSGANARLDDGVNAVEELSSAALGELLQAIGDIGNSALGSQASSPKTANRTFSTAAMSTCPRDPEVVLKKALLLRQNFLQLQEGNGALHSAAKEEIRELRAQLQETHRRLADSTTAQLVSHLEDQRKIEETETRLELAQVQLENGLHLARSAQRRSVQRLALRWINRNERLYQSRIVNAWRVYTQLSQGDRQAHEVEVRATSAAQRFIEERCDAVVCLASQFVHQLERERNRALMSACLDSWQVSLLLLKQDRRWQNYSSLTTEATEQRMRNIAHSSAQRICGVQTRVLVLRCWSCWLDWTLLQGEKDQRHPLRQHRVTRAGDRLCLRAAAYWAGLASRTSVVPLFMHLWHLAVDRCNARMRAVDVSLFHEELRHERQRTATMHSVHCFLVWKHWALNQDETTYLINCQVLSRCLAAWRRIADEAVLLQRCALVEEGTMQFANAQVAVCKLNVVRALNSQYESRNLFLLMRCWASWYMRSVFASSVRARCAATRRAVSFQERLRREQEGVALARCLGAWRAGVEKAFTSLTSSSVQDWLLLSRIVSAWHTRVAHMKRRSTEAAQLQLRSGLLVWVAVNDTFQIQMSFLLWRGLMRECQALRRVQRVLEEHVAKHGLPATSCTRRTFARWKEAWMRHVVANGRDLLQRTLRNSAAVLMKAHCILLLRWCVDLWRSVNSENQLAKTFRWSRFSMISKLQGSRIFGITRRLLPRALFLGWRCHVLTGTVGQCASAIDQLQNDRENHLRDKENIRRMLWVTQAHSASQEDTFTILQLSLVLTTWRGLCREVQLVRQKSLLHQSVVEWSGSATVQRYFSLWKSHWIQKRDHQRDELRASLNDAKLSLMGQIIEMRHGIRQGVSGKFGNQTILLCFSTWRERARATSCCDSFVAQCLGGGDQLNLVRYFERWRAQTNIRVRGNTHLINRVVTSILEIKGAALVRCLVWAWRERLASQCAARLKDDNRSLKSRLDEMGCMASLIVAQNRLVILRALFLTWQAASGFGWGPNHSGLKVATNHAMPPLCNDRIL